MSERGRYTMMAVHLCFLAIVIFVAYLPIPLWLSLIPAVGLGLLSGRIRRTIKRRYP